MNFLKSLVQKFTGKPVDWDELEESLIRADLGVPMTLRITKALQERAERSTITAADIAEVAREEIGRILPVVPVPITPLPAKPKLNIHEPSLQSPKAAGCKPVSTRELPSARTRDRPDFVANC